GIRTLPRHSGLCDARVWLARLERLHRVVGQLLQIRSENVGGDRVAAGAFAAAERVARRDARPQARMAGEPLAQLGDDLGLRVLALFDPQRLEIEVEVPARSA